MLLSSAVAALALAASAVAAVSEEVRGGATLHSADTAAQPAAPPLPTTDAPFSVDAAKLEAAITCPNGIKGAGEHQSQRRQARSHR